MHGRAEHHVTAPAEPRRHRPALDGVRAVAVYLVLLFHSGWSAAGGGFIGVDVFFVLSGFLITTVLFDDIDDTGRIRFGRFYARRARRLLPAAVVTVTATSVVFLAIAGVIERLPLVRDAQSALLYVANWHFLHAQNDYFATGVSKSPFLHFWSLGIEEQFYVVYPLLLLLLMWAGRRRRWVPLAGLAVLFVLSVVAQVHWASADPNHAYYGTDARAYQLLAGGLLACGLRMSRRRPTPAVGEAAAVAGLAAVVVLGSRWVGLGVSGRGMAAAAAATLLIGGLVVAERGRTAALLSRRTPAYLGRISYSTYLWHWPVILVIGRFVRVPPIALAVAAGLIATGLASLSYELLEMPVRRSAALDRFRWATVGAGVGVCALVAAAVVPPVLNSPRRPLVQASRTAVRLQTPIHSGPVAATTPVRAHGHRARVPKGLDWAAMANDQGQQRTCDSSAPQRCIVVRGTGPHVLLVGDSHARMIAPALIALAREHGFTLSLNVISGCPWQAQETNLSRPPSEQAACTAARDVWYRTVLPKLHPDVVILADYARDDNAIYGHTLTRTGGSNETLHQMILNTTNETLARITKLGIRAVIVKDIITSSFDPLACLSEATYLDQCDVPVPLTPPISDSFYDAATVRFAGVSTIDLNPIVCPGAPVCAPMIGRINVWRNVNHYSTKILVHFRAKIWAALQATGALSGLG